MPPPLNNYVTYRGVEVRYGKHTDLGLQALHIPTSIMDTKSYHLCPPPPLFPGINILGGQYRQMTGKGNRPISICVLWPDTIFYLHVEPQSGLSYSSMRLGPWSVNGSMSVGGYNIDVILFAW